jgi:hypothetical protein
MRWETKCRTSVIKNLPGKRGLLSSRYDSNVEKPLQQTNLSPTQGRIRFSSSPSEWRPIAEPAKGLFISRKQRPRVCFHIP